MAVTGVAGIEMNREETLALRNCQLHPQFLPWHQRRHRLHPRWRPIGPAEMPGDPSGRIEFPEGVLPPRHLRGHRRNVGRRGGLPAGPQAIQQHLTPRSGVASRCGLRRPSERGNKRGQIFSAQSAIAGHLLHIRGPLIAHHDCRRQVRLQLQKPLAAHVHLDALLRRRLGSRLRGGERLRKPPVEIPNSPKRLIGKVAAGVARRKP